MMALPRQAEGRLDQQEEPHVKSRIEFEIVWRTGQLSTIGPSIAVDIDH